MSIHAQSARVFYSIQKGNMSDLFVDRVNKRLKKIEERLTRIEYLLNDEQWEQARKKMWKLIRDNQNEK